jgi:hypothetical protein
MDFTQLVLQARPNIKPNSAKTYATSLKLLAPPDAESPTLDFLKDTEAILGKLEKYKMSTKRNYLNAIVIVLKGVEGYEGPLKEYEKLRDSYNDDLSQETQLHTKSERQQEIWIDWPDYLDIVERLRDRVSSLKSGDWTPKQKQAYQDFLITLLYSKYPLRNDWADVMVITKTDYNGLTEDLKRAGNFLVKHNTNKFFFVLNEYKTSAKYGERRIELDADVLPSLRRWLRHNDSPFLLINRKGAPLNSNGITKVLNRIGEQERGKPFGSSILRHSYLSHKYASVVEQKKAQEEDAGLMMHSVSTQQDYVKTD